MRVNWRRDGEHKGEVAKAKSIYGDGPFQVVSIAPCTGTHNPKGWYVRLEDQQNNPVVNDQNEQVVFETYLFEEAIK